MRRIFAMAVVTASALGAVVFGVGASDDAGVGYEVRAIFDNVSGAVKGEDVKIAGAKVGSIKSLDVTKDKKAAVVLRIDEPGFSPFRANAKCTIRPQSLIGEKFVECDPGSSDEEELAEVPDGEDGAGEHLLPIERTSSPVDLDLINNIMRLPYRERLALLINEFGTALAGRGADLNEVIHRANPALRETDKVLKILAGQNRTLADLAKNGDTALAPLARERARLASFIVQADETARASAERRDDLSLTFERLPGFLEELKPTLEDLGALSDEMAPVIADLGEAAPDLNRFIMALGPFSRQSVPSLDSLGEALKIGGPALRRTQPLLEDVRGFATDANPLTKDLKALVTSFDKTGGIERLMDYIFFQVTAINGFDSFSHYLRAGLLASAACSRYQITVAFGCESTFGEAEVEDASSARAGGKIPSHIASTEPPEDVPPVDDSGSLRDDIERIARIEDPSLVKQREAELKRIREGIKSGPKGAYGEEEPFLDYLLGNDE
jgi:ABC-type transporter Mla subunit MlaD